MVSKLINTIAFIIFIPDLLFTLPKSGSRKVVAAVHGILYSLLYMLLTIASDKQNIKKCIESLAGAKGDGEEGGEASEGGGDDSGGGDSGGGGGDSGD